MVATHSHDRHRVPASSRSPRAADTTRRCRFAEAEKCPVGHCLPLGTNGYTTSWGTNAHGELAACPPGRR